jgi:hypothetical protein
MAEEADLRRALGRGTTANAATAHVKVVHQQPGGSDGDNDLALGQDRRRPAEQRGFAHSQGNPRGRTNGHPTGRGRAKVGGPRRNFRVR